MGAKKINRKLEFDDFDVDDDEDDDDRGNDRGGGPGGRPGGGRRDSRKSSLGGDNNWFVWAGIAAVGGSIWWAVEHPGATKIIFVVLFGLLGVSAFRRAYVASARRGQHSRSNAKTNVIVFLRTVQGLLLSLISVLLFFDPATAGRMGFAVLGVLFFFLGSFWGGVLVLLGIISMFYLSHWLEDFP